ncbi:MAG: 16S rRNA (adenine(1518)-N(6)/adenine(1519)-N(6))-dimethyltransferase RsmA [Planctomycetota bacterium]|jgi:16S rRNA (adenine1518-N6/adenine1519-N6)-dimethyltransferase
MQTLSEIRAILAERGLQPRPRLGQHFLHDKNQLRRLVEAAQVKPGDLVLEVGPGTGTLTEALLEAGAEVVACEIDAGLASVIADRLGGRVRLVEGDCLDRGRSLNPALIEALADRPFMLVANLPYQVASTLMGALLVRHPQCRGQFVTIQKEVADRLRARPSTKRRIANVAPSCFWPQPKVTSSMFALRPRADHGLEDPAALSEFVTKLFAARRKQLGTILGRAASTWPEGVTADLRPEALTVEQIVALWKLRG